MWPFKTQVESAEFHFLWNSIGSAPTFVFHYTGNKGLLGIVQSTSLWGTDVRFLNDAKELQIALDAAREVVVRDLVKSPNAHAAQLGAEILAQLKVEPRPVYIFSLTENGDSLSQWRGYCKDSSGYSIGFKYEELSNWCQRMGLTISKVLYGTQVYSQALGQLASAYVEDLESYFPYFAEGGINADLLTGYASRFARRALQTAPLVKHSGFSEENEWRIVEFSDSPNAKTTISYREGVYSLVPYSSWKFEPREFFAALGLVNLKPSQHTQLCSDGLKEFIRSEAQRHGIPETPPLVTEVSEIPFRPGF